MERSVIADRQLLAFCDLVVGHRRFYRRGNPFPPLVIGAIIPLGYAGWIWLQTRARIFEFTSERIRIYEGVLNQDIDEVELYRVKDTRI
ncbi:hypothetical protein N8218_01765 [bacterium]|nr:hypothetical protein [bacterium]